MAQTHLTTQKIKIISHSDSSRCWSEEKGSHVILRKGVLQQAQVKTWGLCSQGKETLQKKRAKPTVSWVPTGIKTQNSRSQLARNDSNQIKLLIDWTGQWSSEHVQTQVPSWAQGCLVPGQNKVRLRRNRVPVEYTFQAELYENLWRFKGIGSGYYQNEPKVGQHSLVQLRPHVRVRQTASIT